MKNYRIGQKVKIKSLEWYYKNKGIGGSVPTYFNFTPEMTRFCGKTFKITFIESAFIRLDYLNERQKNECNNTYGMAPGASVSRYSFSEDMFEKYLNRNIRI